MSITIHPRRHVALATLILFGLWVPAAVAAQVAPGSAPLPPVGVVSFEMQDSTRPDAVDRQHHRQWRVDLYYPAADRTSGTAIRYAPDAPLLERMISDGYYDVPETTLREWARRAGPARRGARPISADPLPLITLSPGSGMAAFNYAELASSLAARGYAVAVIDHPYLGLTHLADGRILSGDDDPVMKQDDPAAWQPRVIEWAGDVSRTIDRLIATSPRNGLTIDAARILSVGHSLGGTVAVEVCSRDARVSACADFEGAVEGTTAYREGTKRPTLLALSRSARADRPHVAPDLGKAPWDFLARGGATSNWGVAISGGSHMSFSDAPWEMPATLSRFGGTLMSAVRSAQVYGGLVDALGRAYFPGGTGSAALATFLSTAPEAKGTRAGATP